MKLLLISGDKQENRLIEKFAISLKLLLEYTATSDKAFELLRNNQYDLLLLNHSTPQLDSFDLIRTCRQRYPSMPIVLLSNPMHKDIQVKALHLGVIEILERPLEVSLFQSRIFNVLTLNKTQMLLSDRSKLLEHQVQEAIKHSKENEHEAIGCLVKSSGYLEDEIGSHQLRVGYISKLLAKALGLSEAMQETIFYASQLHDLGNVTISEHILLKENPLSDTEFEVVKTHARSGYDLLKYSKGTTLKAAAVICYSHHEKFDGSGYPIGLVGETIPLPGRIVAVADVFDTLVTKKIYKEAWETEVACEYLGAQKGKHFDPNIIDLFMQNLDAIQAILAQHK